MPPSGEDHETSEKNLNFTASLEIWRDPVPEVEHVISVAQERRR